MSDLKVFKNDLFEVAEKLENGESIFDVKAVAAIAGKNKIGRNRL